MEILRLNKYEPDFTKPEELEDNAWVLILAEKKILMTKTEDKYHLPRMKELIGRITDINAMEYIGRYDGFTCYCIKLSDEPLLSEDLEPVELREITKYTGDSGLFILAGAANHILHWRSVNRYCGCCGSKTMDKPDERAIICPDCGNTVYPRISPATITAIFRGKQILLAHNRNFNKDMYSLVAGYVEPGETLEHCVEREIREEVGIRVKNIRYAGSQPWPFPDSLMLAFTAEYESGEIAVDNVEITDAGWFEADHLPLIPSIDSIAGRLIRRYRDLYME